MTARTTALGIAAFALAVLPASAGDGAIEIWQSTTITQPGSYVLTRSISSGGDVITIDANDVYLDLNGRTVHLTATLGMGLWVKDTRARITIENGTITSDGGWAIYVGTGVSNLTLRDLVVNGATSKIEGARSSRIANVVFSCDSHLSIFTACTGCDITGNVIRNASGGGMEIAGDDNLIERNAIEGCQGIGLEISGHRNFLFNNQLSGNASYGLKFKIGNYNVYRANVARGNTGTGCTGPSTADLCDQGIVNTSHGDNYMPDQR